MVYGNFIKVYNIIFVYFYVGDSIHCGYYHTAYGETKNVCTFLKPFHISLLSLLTIKNGVRTPPIDAPIHHKRLVFLKYVISKKLSVIINVVITPSKY